MAFILKSHSPDQKGLLLFTHKEISVLQKTEKKYPNIIQHIKRDYFVGMHFGWFWDNPPIPYMIDFILGGHNTASNLPQNILHIPLLSRDFVPQFFGQTPRNSDTIFWDIVCIAHNGKGKRLDDFLTTMRKVMDRRPHTKILLVTSGPKTQREPRFYAGLRQDYNNMFNKDERKLFSIIDYRREKNELYALGYQAVPWILSSAKIFTLYSKVEGGSKIISESLVSGTPVVARSTLIGGGLDHLNDNNSALFNTLDEAADIFIQKLNNTDPWHFDRQPYIEKMREDYSFAILKEHLQRLYGDTPLALNFVPNLARKLPAHENVLPAALTNTATDDLNSPYSVKIFIEEYVYNKAIPVHKRALLLIAAKLFVWQKKLIPTLKASIKFILIRFKLWPKG